MSDPMGEYLTILQAAIAFKIDEREKVIASETSPGEFLTETEGRLWEINGLAAALVLAGEFERSRGVVRDFSEVRA